MVQKTNNKNPSPLSYLKGGRRSSRSSEKKPTVQVIAQIEKKRDERRKAAAELIEERRKENELNEKLGRPGDVDFQRMIKQFKLANANKKRPYTKASLNKITICVRKRPVNAKEVKRKDHDAVSCFNPAVIVHDCKLRVDGITKYLDNNEFVFDNSFDEDAKTEDIYQCCVQHLIPFVFDENGRATVFAYGQTGSGKTYTMEAIQRQATTDLFNYISFYQSRGKNLKVFVSFFELYSGKCQDLLTLQRLTIREDGKGEVQIVGLQEMEVSNIQELLKVIDMGNSKRTTRKTEVNDQSSRSHCICQINIRCSDTMELHGKLSLIDLAGSERGQDTKNHNKQRRIESSEINKSLLALKECFRALDIGNPATHIPFRASQLTQVLKDSFMNHNARTVMIAAISPCASSADHTVNTLRYADRVKEKPAMLNNTNGYEDHNQDDEIIDPADISSSINADDIDETNADNEVNEGNEDSEINDDNEDNENSIDSPDNIHDFEEDANYCDQEFSMQDISTDQIVINEKKNQNDIKKNASSELGFEQREELLNAHHASIKRNAELLTEESSLFALIQGGEFADMDIDVYTSRLLSILDKKDEITNRLRGQLNAYRKAYIKE